MCSRVIIVGTDPSTITPREGAVLPMSAAVEAEPVRLQFSAEHQSGISLCRRRAHDVTARAGANRLAHFYPTVSVN
jgi:hypothetical protein